MPQRQKVKVRKRDGSIEDFDPQKITRVARVAGLSHSQAGEVTNNVKKWVYNSKKESVSSLGIKDEVLKEFKKVSRYAAGLYKWYEEIKDKK